MKEISELKALVSLVDEPDERLFAQISSRILSYGADAIPDLEAAWEGTLDTEIQERLIELIHQIQQQEVYAELNNWGMFNYDDLLRGFMIITQYQYPDLDIDKLTREVGHIVQEVYLELNNQLTALEKVKVLNHVFYDINKFAGNTANIQLPENFYLKNLLETRKGNPLSLGVFYLIIARSMRLPIYGVDLPKHFVLAYTDGLNDDPKEDDVLFYLNPFNKGAVFTKNEIDLYIKQLRLEKSEEYYQPCDHRTIIRRLINGLAESYQSAGNHDKSNELLHLLKALDNGKVK